MSPDFTILPDGPLIVMGKALLTHPGETPSGYFPDSLAYIPYDEKQKELLLKLSDGFKKACDQYTDGGQEQDACWHGVMFGLNQNIVEGDGRVECSDYVNASANAEACRVGESVSKPKEKKVDEPAEEPETDEELPELDEDDDDVDFPSDEESRRQEEADRQRRKQEKDRERAERETKRVEAKEKRERERDTKKAERDRKKEERRRTPVVPAATKKAEKPVKQAKQAKEVKPTRRAPIKGDQTPPLFQAEFNYSGLHDSLALEGLPSMTLDTVYGAPLGFEGRVGFRGGGNHFKLIADFGVGYTKRSTGNKAVGGRDTYLEEGRFSFGITPLAQISLGHQARLMVGGEIRGFASLLDAPPLTTEEICLGHDDSGNCAEYSQNLVGGFLVVPDGAGGFENTNLKGWGYGFETGPEVVFGTKNLEVGARFGFQQAYFPDDREQTGSYQGSFFDFIVRGVFP